MQPTATGSVRLKGAEHGLNGAAGGVAEQLRGQLHGLGLHEVVRQQGQLRQQQQQEQQERAVTALHVGTCGPLDCSGLCAASSKQAILKHQSCMTVKLNSVTV
jgi:hypothetical protein